MPDLITVLLAALLVAAIFVGVAFLVFAVAIMGRRPGR